jgi:hypothetical protein
MIGASIRPAITSVAISFLPHMLQYPLNLGEQLGVLFAQPSEL